MGRGVEGAGGGGAPWLEGTERGLGLGVCPCWRSPPLPRGLRRCSEGVEGGRRGWHRGEGEGRGRGKPWWQWLSSGEGSCS